MLLTVLFGNPGSGKTTLLEKLKEKNEIDIILGDDILSNFFSDLIYNKQNIPLHSLENVSEILEALFRIERKRGLNFFTNNYKWGVALLAGCNSYNKVFVRAPRIDLDSFVLGNIIFKQLNFMEYKITHFPVCRVDFKVNINAEVGGMFSYNSSRRNVLTSIIDEYFDYANNTFETKAEENIENIKEKILEKENKETFLKENILTGESKKRKLSFEENNNNIFVDNKNQQKRKLSL